MVKEGSNSGANTRFQKDVVTGAQWIRDLLCVSNQLSGHVVHNGGGLLITANVRNGYLSPPIFICLEHIDGEGVAGAGTPLVGKRSEPSNGFDLQNGFAIANSYGCFVLQYSRLEILDNECC